MVETDLLPKSPVESVEEREDSSDFPMFDEIDGIQSLSMPAKHVHSPAHTMKSPEHDHCQHRPHMLCM